MALKHYFLSALTVLLSASYAHGFMSFDNSDTPLEIMAIDKLEWNQEDGTYKAIGNARIHKNDHFAYADQFFAYADQNSATKEIKLIKGQGNIHLEHLNNHAYGEKLNYDLEKGLVVLTEGNLRFITPTYTVTARDQLSFDENQNKAVAAGNAKAVKEESTIHSDTLITWLTENASSSLEMSKSEAIGHVKIVTANDIAFCDRAEYSANDEQAYLFNNVKIVRGENQILGSKAVINLKTGQSKMLTEANPENKDASKERVKGILHLDRK